MEGKIVMEVIYVCWNANIFERHGTDILLYMYYCTRGFLSSDCIPDTFAMASARNTSSTSVTSGYPL